MKLKYPLTMAHKTLKNYSDGTYPTDVKEIARKAGITISEIELDDDVWAVYEPRKKEIFLRKQDHEHRKRFSLAHELGHHFMSHCDGLHVEKFYRNKDAIEGIYKIEIEANQFAAELLMPSFEVEKQMKPFVDKKGCSLDQVITKLAKHFRVSTAAVENRLKNLGYLVMTDVEISGK